AARLNVRNPSMYPLIAENSPTFTTDSGFQGDGTTQALHVDGYDLATGMSITNTHAGVYNVATGGAGGNDLGVESGSVRFRVSFKQTGTSVNNIYSANNFSFTTGGPSGSRYF